MEWYCPKCGESKDIDVEIEEISPGVIFECPECRARFRVEFETEYDPDDDDIAS